MALFVTVIIYDPRKVFSKAFRPCFVGGYITRSSENTRARIPLFVFLLLKPFLDSFRAFLEVSVLLKKLFAGLGSWTLGFLILGSFIAMLWVYTFAAVM